MDETPMHFKPHSNQTLEFSGSKAAAVKSQSFKVVLVVAENGTKGPQEFHLHPDIKKDVVVTNPLSASFPKEGKG